MQVYNELEGNYLQKMSFIVLFIWWTFVTKS